MKVVQNIKSLCVVLMVAAGLIFNSMGCEYVPVEPEADTTAEQNGFEIISLGPEMASINLGAMTASALVTPEAGGQLVMIFGDVQVENDSVGIYTDAGVDSTLDYTDVGIDSLSDPFGNSGTAYSSLPGIKVELTVLPQSVIAATELVLVLDGLNVDMEFGPDGLVFQNPALLNVTATGLDLSNVNEETLDLYYDNTVTGQWEKVERENVIVTKATGTLQIVNARIPHFSRYAVAWSQ